ncbi:MAG: N-6 DNA methylase, partial [Ignavibacteriales bacterium]|nr:N-6 DNA methylase [Ignavibacteriales bacterium]
MNKKISEHIQEYRKRILDANSEAAKKEIFKTLLIRLFDKEPGTAKLINDFDSGAETCIHNIPMPKKSKTGYADTQYRNVIIEFERDLNATGAHAIEQLSEYLAGNWLSGNDFNFTLISTDCLAWKIFYPDYETLLTGDIILANKIVLKEKDSFTLTDKNAQEFFFFLDHYLFRTQAQTPTIASVRRDFGDSSPVFLNSLRILNNYWSLVVNDSDIRIAYEQWRLFLSIAYGSFSASERVFLIHTYLSIFSKLLAYTVISGQRFINDAEMQGIISGEIFQNMHVNNFIERDFYHWVGKPEHYNNLKDIFRKIAVQLSDYDFTLTQEDILKGIYQELIDLDTRHALGEYYTPDWLAERIVAHLPLQANSMCLDPSCGSGSFLRAVVAKFKTDFPEVTIESLMAQVVGIDIHPLSVQIAKTTLLIAVADRLKKIRKPINLQVYLADTLRIPDESTGLWADHFEIDIDNEKHQISKQLLAKPSIFDSSISLCQELAEMNQGEPDFALPHFTSIAQSRLGNDFSKDIFLNLHAVYIALKQAIAKKRDSIWAFIILNSHKPVFLKGLFDFVIGNPPWLAYRDLNNEPYQDRLKRLAASYRLVPKSESITHLELAAIFLSHCSATFLKPSGKLAFVLPRGFLSADHHHNTRSGIAKGFRITEIWDLKDVSPLFRITSCVLFASQALRDAGQTDISLLYPEEGLPGFIVSGILKAGYVNWAYANEHLTFESVQWYYAVLGKRSAFSLKQTAYSTKGNFYLERFKQGATIVPRNFYFVELLQDIPDDFRDRILVAQTDQIVKKDAKKPWADIELKGKINSKFLFRSALAKNILPFSLVSPQLVHLPVTINPAGYAELVSSQTMLSQDALESSKWFKNVELNWNNNKTEKSEKITYLEWLNYQNKIVDQNLNFQYLVLYTASAKDANAAIIDRSKLDLPFIVESKTYWFATNSLPEAQYLVAFLNSIFANFVIKDFQSTGL